MITVNEKLEKSKNKSFSSWLRISVLVNIKHKNHWDLEINIDHPNQARGLDWFSSYYKEKLPDNRLRNSPNKMITFERKSKVGQISGCHKKTERIVHYEDYSCDHRFLEMLRAVWKSRRKCLEVLKIKRRIEIG